MAKDSQNQEEIAESTREADTSGIVSYYDALALLIRSGITLRTAQKEYKRHQFHPEAYLDKTRAEGEFDTLLKKLLGEE